MARWRVPRECRLRVGGHSSHVAPRSCRERERETIRRCSILLSCVNRSQPAQHGARAWQARMFCHQSTESQRSGAFARATRKHESRLRVRGHSSHVTPRSCTEGERLPVSAVPFHVAYYDDNQRSAAPARSTLVCFTTSRKTVSVVGLARVPRECRLRVGGHSSHAAPRSCNQRESPPVGAVPIYSTGGGHSQRGTAHARGKLACSATSRDTASVVALAHRPRESRLKAGGHSLHVAPRSCTEEERPPAGAVPFRAA